MAGARPTKLSERVAYTPDRAALQAQTSTANVAHATNQLAFASGNLLDRDQDANGKPIGNHSGVPFTANQARTLSHGLQRVPNGFIVVDLTGDATVFTRSACTSTTITILSASLLFAGCVAKIWVW